MKNKTFSIKTSIDTSSNVQNLFFEGNLALINAAAIKKTIQTMSFKSDSVIIHLRSVEKLDITFIQIIRALRIALENDGKQTSTVAVVPGDIERLLTNSGFHTTL